MHSLIRISDNQVLFWYEYVGTYGRKLFIVCLKFKFKRACCLLLDNSTRRVKARGIISDAVTGPLAQTTVPLVSVKCSEIAQTIGCAKGCWDDPTL